VASVRGPLASARTVSGCIGGDIAAGAPFSLRVIGCDLIDFITRLSFLLYFLLLGFLGRETFIDESVLLGFNVNSLRTCKHH
jgi:hypothetical protein